MYPQKGPLTQRTLPLPLALVPAALSQTRGVGKAEEGPPSWFMPLEITLHPVSPIIAPPIHLSRMVQLTIKKLKKKKELHLLRLQ